MDTLWSSFDSPFESTLEIGSHVIVVLDSSTPTSSLCSSSANRVTTTNRVSGSQMTILSSQRFVTSLSTF